MFKKFFSKNRDDLLFLGLTILLSIPLILPYLKTGYFPTHDGEWAVVRLGEMFREIKDLQFPPRYSTVLNNGYGYPLFNFAYPFPYYIALIFKMLGFGFIESIKIVFALTVPLSGIGMYLLSKNLWKNKTAGIISAVLYMYLPYRLVDLYVRGSIGESLALAIIPFLFYLAILIKDKSKPWIFVAVSSLLLGSLILTHNIMAVYFVPLYIFFCILINVFSKKRFDIRFVYILILGIGLSSFFWFPALFEKNNILLSVIPIADRDLYYVSLHQLIVPSWGYGVPADSKGAFSYQLGIGVISSILLTLGVLIWGFVKKTKFDASIKVAGAFVGIWVFIILMMFEYSRVVWESLPILSEINYPWTLLAPIGFVGTLLAGFVVSKSKILLYVFIAIVMINAQVVLAYAKPEKTTQYEDGYYFTNVANTTSSNEYTPLWVKELPKQKPQQAVEVLKGEGSIENIVIKSNRISFGTNMRTDGTIRINTIYYPGWNIFVDNQMRDFTYNNSLGVMEVTIPTGSTNVEAKFVETKTRLISDFVSVVSALAIVALFGIGLFQPIKKHDKEK